MDAKVGGRAMILGQCPSRVFLYLEGLSFGLWVATLVEPLMPARAD